jgi:transcriptional regulator with XRE-family HTH domain
MLAQNIKKFRTQLGLSQEELARKAGITYSTLIKLESGVNKNPTVKTLQQLAGALEVSLDQLVESESPSK